MSQFSKYATTHYRQEGQGVHPGIYLLGAAKPGKHSFRFSSSLSLGGSRISKFTPANDRVRVPLDL